MEDYISEYLLDNGQTIQFKPKANPVTILKLEMPETFEFLKSKKILLFHLTNMNSQANIIRNSKSSLNQSYFLDKHFRKKNNNRFSSNIFDNNVRNKDDKSIEGKYKIILLNLKRKFLIEGFSLGKVQKEENYVNELDELNIKNENSYITNNKKCLNYQNNNDYSSSSSKNENVRRTLKRMKIKSHFYTIANSRCLPNNKFSKLPDIKNSFEAFSKSNSKLQTNSPTSCKSKKVCISLPLISNFNDSSQVSNEGSFLSDNLNNEMHKNPFHLLLQNQRKKNFLLRKNIFHNSFKVN